MRTFLAALAGILSVYFFKGLFEYLGYLIAPIDKFIGDPTSKEEITNYFQSFPSNHLILLIVAHISALFCGVIIVRLIDRTSKTPILATAVVVFLLTVLTTLLFPYPTWFKTVDLSLLLIACIGVMLTKKKA